MEVIAKIYESMRSNTPILQEKIISEIKIDEDLSSFDIAIFQLPVSSLVEEYNKIELYEVNNWIDTLIFSWYIYKVQPIRRQFWLYNVTCRSEKALLQERNLLSWYWTLVKPLSNIIQELLSWYNALWENWQVQCDINVSIIYSAYLNDSIYDILDDFAKKYNAVWKVQKWVILFSETLWIDRSVDWPYYQELSYDNNQPWSANIADVSVDSDATRKNIVIAKDYYWWWQVDTSNVSIDGKVYWVKCEDIFTAIANTIQMQEAVTNLLAKINRKQRTYSFTAEQNTINANVGDRVRIVIENTNSDFDINWDILVLKKSTTYTNATKMSSYTTWELQASPFTYSNWFLWVEKAIRYLQNKE